jgi:hypothetical protein
VGLERYCPGLEGFGLIKKRACDRHEGPGEALHGCIGLRKKIVGLGL